MRGLLVEIRSHHTRKTIEFRQGEEGAAPEVERREDDSLGVEEDECKGGGGHGNPMLSTNTQEAEQDKSKLPVVGLR